MQLFYLAAYIAVTAAVVWIGLFLASRPLAGAILVIITFLCEAIMVELPAIPLGVLIYPADIVFGLLFIAAVFRYTQRKARPTRTQWIVISLFVLFFFSLARGVVSYGLKDAGNASREWFCFLSGLLYFSSFNVRRRWLTKLTSIWLVASMVLAGLAILRWMATLPSLSIGAQWEGVGGSDIRVLNASQANFLALGFFASFFLGTLHAGKSWQRRAFYLFGPILLLLQQRTVWVVMLVGMAWLALQGARFRKKAFVAIGGLALAGIILIVLLFGRDLGIATASLQDYASNNSTFIWRVAGWYQLLGNDARTPLNLTVGQPFGTGFERVMSGVRVNVAPHNWYVETFLSLGLIGLLLLIWLYTRGWRHTKCLPAPLCRYVYPDARFWQLVLLLQLVYFVTYGADYAHSVLTGIALAGLRFRLVRPLYPKLPHLPPATVP